LIHKIITLTLFWSEMGSGSDGKKQRYTRGWQPYLVLSTVWHCCLKIILFCIYLYFTIKFILIYFIFYLISWVLVSTCNYFQVPVDSWVLTCGSESPSGWNPHRSKYGISKLKYLWVQIPDHPRSALMLCLRREEETTQMTTYIIYVR